MSTYSILRRVVPAAIVVVGLCTWPSVGQLQDAEPGRQAAGKDWPFLGGDWGNTRYSSLTQITPANVKTLAGAWVKTFDGGTTTRATPVVKDGVLYIAAGSTVHALEAATGESKWQWKAAPGGVVGASAERAEALPGAGVGGVADIINAQFGIPNSQAVALGEGLVFVGLMDGKLVALDEQTGQLVWSQRLGNEQPRKGEAISAAPVYARGMVFAGLANGDWAFRGRMIGVDAKTGKIRWTFYAIPGPGEYGHDTWPQDSDIWEKGGGGVWHVANADADLGLVYYVTGNAVPAYGGEARKGDNLFTASVVALDMQTGTRRWHYQVVHHDIWEADIAIAPMAYDATVNGRRQKAIAVMRADGYLFLLDAATGTPVLPVEERPVMQDPFNLTAPTQPFPVNADRLVPGCERYQAQVPPEFVVDCSGFTPQFLDKHNVVGAGAASPPSVRITPMSYSAQTGYFYAQGSSAMSRARRISKDPFFRGFLPFLSGILPEGVGVLAAIDSRTNKIVWKKEMPPNQLGNSGPLTTASGLLFRASGVDGAFEAYDAKTGDAVWRFEMGRPGSRGSASTYAVGGEQFIALAAGRELWAFKLGGAIAARPAPAPAAPRAGGAGGQETDEIETATLVLTPPRGVGRRYAMDEHAFNPLRARAKVGTRMSFVNNGELVHTITAKDGSWTTPTLKTAEVGYAVLTTPGVQRYYCKEHPWAIGEIVVTE